MILIVALAYIVTVHSKTFRTTFPGIKKAGSNRVLRFQYLQGFMTQSGCDGDNRPGLFQVLALARLSYWKLLRLWVWLTILDPQKSGWVETKHTHTRITIYICVYLNTTVILLYIYLVLYICNTSSTHNRPKWPLVGLVGPIGSDPLPPKGRHGLPCESCGAALCWPSMAPWRRAQPPSIWGEEKTRFPVDFPWNQSAEHRKCL